MKEQKRFKTQHHNTEMFSRSHTHKQSGHFYVNFSYTENESWKHFQAVPVSYEISTVAQEVTLNNPIVTN